MKIKVDINVKWGSEFQRDCGLNMLEIYLREWKEFYEKVHSQTKIDYKLKIK